jgi:riboflavin synthase
MFTGLIADRGTVEELAHEDGGARLTIATSLASEIGPGDSVAVNGVCLTATEVSASGFSAQAMRETLSRSSLAALRRQSPVNLELALRAGDRLGGHIVQGHVDATGTVRGVREDGAARVLELEPPAQLLRYLVQKGSIAVDGVSLTVSELGEESFSVSLIAETLMRTNLGMLEEGMRVNLEVDVLAKHVERLMEARI